ncbi:MAG: DUF3052 family protein, partial [Deltaproteobacteria bacterium]|nr:DUF3052 family protein [Deltaproteobacteria bacterium]
MAGYPGTPLPKKLGIKAGHKVCLLNAPGTFERNLAFASRNDDVRITHDLRLPPVDVVVLFIDRLADLEHRFADIVARLHPTGRLWVAWRTRRSVDVTEDVVRRVALAAGMVNNKSCSLDDCWSGVRLVLRGEHRDMIGYRVAAEPPATLSRRLTSRRRPTTTPARMAHRLKA